LPQTMILAKSSWRLEVNVVWSRNSWFDFMLCNRMDVSNNYHQILQSFEAIVREVIQLMSSSSSNKRRCLLKVENCLMRLNSLRGILPINQFSSIEQSLKNLHDEISNEGESEATPDITAFTAPRLQSGICDVPQWQVISCVWRFAVFIWLVQGVIVVFKYKLSFYVVHIWLIRVYCIMCWQVHPMASRRLKKTK
jgi:hypothetical protein